MFSILTIFGTSPDFYLSGIGYLSAQDSFNDWKKVIKQIGLEVTEIVMYPPTEMDFRFLIIGIAEKVRETEDGFYVEVQQKLIKAGA